MKIVFVMFYVYALLYKLSVRLIEQLVRLLYRAFKSSWPLKNLRLYGQASRAISTG